MTNKELQELLKTYPDDVRVLTNVPVQGDCENCRDMAHKDVFF